MKNIVLLSSQTPPSLLFRVQMIAKVEMKFL